MVMTGDMFDRGHQINEVLWFMYKLDKQASEAGGKLHLLMGNHEQMVMRGDLRYVNERYQVAEKLLNRPYDELYDNSSEIGQWLRSKNTVVKINDSLFLHGGISSEWIERELTLDKANTLYRANIDKSKEELKQDKSSAPFAQPRSHQMKSLERLSKLFVDLTSKIQKRKTTKFATTKGNHTKKRIK